MRVGGASLLGEIAGRRASEESMVAESLKRARVLKKHTHDCPNHRDGILRVHARNAILRNLPPIQFEKRKDVESLISAVRLMCCK